MASTTTLISVEEYLRTVYRPDCDYVDGEVLERNMGEKPHSRLQKFFINFFKNFEEEYAFETLPEQRLQISPTRFRIPDVMLSAVPNADELIVRTPPFLCIEILSSNDRMAQVRERIADYAGIGVGTSWVVDPWRRMAYTAGLDGVLHETDSVLTARDGSIALEVKDLFAELDRRERRASGN